MFMKDFTRAAANFSPAAQFAAPVISGLLAGTRVETATGWTDVECLRIGDRVQTLDGGLVRLLAVDRRILNPGAEQPVLVVPGGVHGACSDLMLLPGQHLARPTGGDVGGADDLYALFPALAIEGRQGVMRRYLMHPIAVITPLFATEELVWANSGVLLHCPGIATGAAQGSLGDFFPRLDLQAARAWLAQAQAQDRAA